METLLSPFHNYARLYMSPRSHHTASFMQTNPKLEKMKMDCYKDVKGTIYENDALTLNGKEHIQFKQYVGKHVLFVNVATYCGLTALYPELNTRKQELKPFDLVVQGFPCNQFGKQEPGENSEILLGLNTPVLTLLSLWTHSDISWEPIKVHDIRWNFEKFLVGPDGVPVMRQFHRAPVSVVKSDILAYLKQFKTK